MITEVELAALEARWAEDTDVGRLITEVRRLRAALTRIAGKQHYGEDIGAVLQNIAGEALGD